MDLFVQTVTGKRYGVKMICLKATKLAAIYQI